MKEMICRNNKRIKTGCVMKIMTQPVFMRLMLNKLYIILYIIDYGLFFHCQINPFGFLIRQYPRFLKKREKQILFQDIFGVIVN